MDRCRPDFLVVGAMKCATTTLHEQLARQRGFFMTKTKEPNFFSDDDVYERGIAWYESLFADAREGELRGESSTHYTKLPTYPRTVERIVRTLPRVKVVYVMRHPIDRLVSHYVHERSIAGFAGGLDEAIERWPVLIHYGCYDTQIQPYLDAYGAENVLPVFFGRLTSHPQSELERICRFLGSRFRPVWDSDLKAQNVGKERLRRSRVRDVLIYTPVLGRLRRRLVPRSWTEPVKSLWRIRFDAPAPSPELRDQLRAQFDPELARLGAKLGVHLDCAGFHQQTSHEPLDWAGASRGRTL